MRTEWKPLGDHIQENGWSIGLDGSLKQEGKWSGLEYGTSVACCKSTVGQTFSTINENEGMPSMISQDLNKGINTVNK